MAWQIALNTCVFLIGLNQMMPLGNSPIILSIRRRSKGEATRPVAKAPSSTPQINWIMDRLKIVKAQSMNFSGTEAVMNSLLPILHADVVIYHVIRISSVTTKRPAPPPPPPPPATLPSFPPGPVISRSLGFTGLSVDVTLNVYSWYLSTSQPW